MSGQRCFLGSKEHLNLQNVPFGAHYQYVAVCSHTILESFVLFSSPVDLSCSVVIKLLRQVANNIMSKLKMLQETTSFKLLVSWIARKYLNKYCIFSWWVLFAVSIAFTSLQNQPDIVFSVVNNVYPTSEDSSEEAFWLRINIFISTNVAIKPLLLIHHLYRHKLIWWISTSSLLTLQPRLCHFIDICESICSYFYFFVLVVLPKC